ncbi:MAG: hypothetical protein HY332_01855 [Chloroflexi bacterium]|nr:hypothetical protein [Chloroflexota bacterium]
MGTLTSAPSAAQQESRTMNGAGVVAHASMGQRVPAEAAIVPDVMASHAAIDGLVAVVGHVLASEREWLETQRARVEQALHLVAPPGELPSGDPALGEIERSLSALLEELRSRAATLAQSAAAVESVVPLSGGNAAGSVYQSI